LSGWFDGEDAADATPLAAETARPGTAPPDEDAQRGTRDEPFRGSPAVRWADGAAGIHVPAARATGWMGKEQVARALARTRDFLVASSLDPDVLRGERPTKALAFINPKQPGELTSLNRSLSSPSKEDNPLSLFSRFDTTQARLVGDVVKTRGRMTYRTGRNGAVEVTTDVTYVYPTVPAQGGSDDVVRTIVRREVVVNWHDPNRTITAPDTFSVVSTSLDTTNAGCDTYNGYLTPAFGARQGGDGPLVDPYDRSTSMRDRTRGADGEGCGTATRS
ncbi:hypothetical protein G3I40_18795, partial [Streptomyces sp. SID14478]|uniref:hypothetical protein n=1 Tax=Streptomyces sp. SID14478 TaxID=2706073 RepID=UPI0013D9190C